MGTTAFASSLHFAFSGVPKEGLLKKPDRLQRSLFQRSRVDKLGSIRAIHDCYNCCKLQMHRKHHNGQLSIEEFHVPFGGTLDPEKRWVLFSVLVGSLQGYALSLNGLRRQVDPHWKRGMSFLRIGLAVLQMSVSKSAVRLMTWLPIPIQNLERCIPSRKATRKQTRAWFSMIELPPRSRSAADQTPPLPGVA